MKLTKGYNALALGMIRCKGLKFFIDNGREVVIYNEHYIGMRNVVCGTMKGGSNSLLQKSELRTSITHATSYYFW